MADWPIGEMFDGDKASSDASATTMENGGEDNGEWEKMTGMGRRRLCC
jgi:hypothetical protein